MSDWEHEEKTLVEMLDARLRACLKAQNAVVKCVQDGDYARSVAVPFEVLLEAMRAFDELRNFSEGFVVPFLLANEKKKVSGD